jgi:hypothetical protein
MEAIGSSESIVTTYKNTWRLNSKDHTLIPQYTKVDLHQTSIESQCLETHYYQQQSYQKFATSERSLQAAGKRRDASRDLMSCDEAVIRFGGIVNRYKAH